MKKSVWAFADQTKVTIVYMWPWIKPFKLFSAYLYVPVYTMLGLVCRLAEGVSWPLGRSLTNPPPARILAYVHNYVIIIDMYVIERLYLFVIRRFLAKKLMTLGIAEPANNHPKLWIWPHFKRLQIQLIRLHFTCSELPSVSKVLFNRI